MTETHTFDVVIIGGGVIGSSIAYFLAAEDAFHGSVLVVEKAPSYADGSTARSVGGLRQQFSTPENIKISKFGARFVKSVGEHLAVDGDAPDVSFEEAGYLLLASPAGLEILEANHALQKAYGADVVLLSPDDLKRRFPWLHTSDLAGGSLGLSGEGWLDPYSLLMAFRKKALALGVSYEEGEVTALERRGSRVTSVVLADGRSISAGHVVNAAGPRAAEVASMAGIDNLPVRSRKRFVFIFECPEEIRVRPLEGIEGGGLCPLVVDPTGFYFRPESGKFLCGISPPADADPDCHDFKLDRRLFEDVIWPGLAHRVPAFELLREGTSWAGHYAVNTRDRNAILGPHPEVRNFYFANGFSGHGLQQSPAVGRGIAELVTFGVYRTLDLTRFGFERFATGRLIAERNVI